MRRFSNGVVGASIVGQLNAIENRITTAEANTSLKISGNGTGVVDVEDDLQIRAGKALNIFTSNDGYALSISAGSMLSAYNLTMPSSQAAQYTVLTASDSSGNLTWAIPTLTHTPDTSTDSVRAVPYFDSTVQRVQTLNTDTTKLGFNPSSDTLFVENVDVNDSITAGVIVSETTIKSEGNFYLNDTNITSNYTIPSTENAMSAGPITINSGITVTVQGNWSIV